MLSSLTPLTLLATLLMVPVASFVSAQDSAGLSESQIAIIRKQIEALKSGQQERNLSKNSSAEQIFRSAASSQRATVELYLKCRKQLDFERLDKSDSDFRKWEDQQNALLDFEPFVTSLQLQLHYLALATRAAREEQISSVFGDLKGYMGKLASLSHPPHPMLNKPVTQSVFAQAFELDTQLNRAGQNNWELNPMNVAGIYEKTILPYLRTTTPESLDNAWSSRIQQESALAQLFFRFEEGMERFLQRNETPGGPQRGVNQHLKEMAKFVSTQAKQAAVFNKKKLPRLKWAQLKDRFQYGNNQALAAKAMLDMIQAYLGHEDAARWISELETMVASGDSSSESE